MPLETQSIGLLAHPPSTQAGAKNKRQPTDYAERVFWSPLTETAKTTQRMTPHDVTAEIVKNNGLRLPERIYQHSVKRRRGLQPYFGVLSYIEATKRAVVPTRQTRLMGDGKRRYDCVLCPES